MRRPTPLRQAWLLAMNDLRLTVKDKTSLVWMLIFPVALMWFFGESFSGGPDGPPKISLTVDDRDHGWLARALVDELEDEQVSLYELVDGDGETPRIRTLVLPEGLTAGALAGRRQTVRLEVDPDADRAFGMGAEIHVRRAIVRVLGRLLETRIAAGDEEAENRYRELEKREQLVRLEVSAAGEGDVIPSGYGQSVPGILTMIVLMMTLIYGGIFLILEKQQGMLRRQLSLPMTRGTVVAGKIAGRLMIAAVQIVLLLSAARFVFGFSLGTSPAGLALLTSTYAVAVACLSILLGAVLTTTEQASMVGWIASMVMAGLGGCWWPSEVMPEWLRTAAHVFPTAWAMDGFHALISFGRGVESVWIPSLVLLAFGALSGVLGARFLRVA